MAEPTSTARGRMLRRRVIVVAAVFAVWAVVVEARLVQLQVVQRAAWQARADGQWTRTVPVPARRGEILDRGGRVLAYSVDEDAIYAVPAEVGEPADMVASLCQPLGDCTPAERETLLRRLSSDKAFVWVRRASQVTPEQTARVRALNLPGIGFKAENRRHYPCAELAAHLLGYVGTDDGLSGLERAYDKDIAGRRGAMLIETDGAHRPFSRLQDASTEGGTLQLTIDHYLQYVAERELRAGVTENRAAGGTALIMDPRTGEILALANEPTFDPNAYARSSDEERRNRGVQDVYEPGSTFKVVTASAAIEERVMTPADLIDVSAGQIQLGSRVVHDTHRYGVLSFTDVLVKSSNVGAIKIGLRLGAERLGRYVHRFGFSTRLSPDFPAESAGIMWDPAHWSDSALASVSMGYQIGVTPLQMATAVSAVANGGDLFEPRVVKAVVKGGVRREVHPKVLRRAIERDTAEQLTTIMEDVVARGTATAAQIPGYTIAGKTGTSAKLENGHYSKQDFNASFVGFLPSRQPALAIIVVIDAPHGARGYYGGAVAAPVFKRIAEDAVRHLGIAPSVNAPPPLLVTRPAPEPPSAGTIVIRTVASGGTASGQVPDVIGLSARDALRVLSRAGLVPRMTGDGVVVQQEPTAGTPLERGAACTLSLGRVVSAPSVAGSEPRR